MTGPPPPLPDLPPGGRVVLRHRTPDGGATDVLGELVEDAPGHLAVRDRAGGLHRVAREDVVAARPVPPRVRRRGADDGPVVGVCDLEAALALAWQAPSVARDGRWLLRSAGDRTRRASSVLALGGPGTDDLDAAVHAAGAWQRARGSTPRFQLPRATGAPAGRAARADAAALLEVSRLDAVLAARGWPLVSPTTVLTGRTGRVLDAVAGRGDAGVRLTPVPDAAWTALVRPGAPDDPVTAGLLVSAPEQVFAAVDGPGGAAAVGRLALADGWAVLTDLVVAPAARRRGLARAVVGALLGAAGDLPGVALQVADGNAPARALYAGLGLAEHHRYAYREEPAAPSA
ncbi:GNAT family N-acetyltransferase [Pseudokineococcus lusitanus]|uniref:GNAT family N-acetyltransferase n=1 Tax=Pseudokineococcus lusitanus TaxID=763993 RepID=UPI000F4A8048|nr:GNAT family N-acetyltransferase [Pseudokineococcus lusitanus]